MLLSMVLAWLAAAAAAVAAFRYVARKSGSKKLNRSFHKSHILFGALLAAFGTLHGLIAGNPSFATLSDMSVGSVLFTWNWGSACLVAAILLALTYIFRKSLKRLWMPLHRILTVALIALVVIHVANVGIHIDDRIKALGETQTAVSSSVSSSAASSSSQKSSSSSAASSAAGSASSASSSSAAASSSAASSSAASSSSAAAASSAAASSSGTSSSQSVSVSSSGSGTTVTSGGSGATFSGAVLKDGTYQGSANGYSGTTTVSVTVSGGSVTDITVVSENDSQQFFSRAETLLDTIVGEQSLEVDAVSGATYSSAGLVNAVYNALQGAVESGTLSVTTITPTGGRGH